MKQINIELLTSQGSDEAVANAARVSFSSFGNWNEIPAGYTKEKSNKLIKYLADHKHLCVFRHNLVTIKCKAPIFLARQLGKHQVGLTWSEVSRRYVKSEPEFFEPEQWRKAPDGSIKQGSGGFIDDQFITKERYTSYINTSVGLYNDLLDEGVAPEMARMVLPQSMQTEWIWSGNILAFAHVYKERIAEGAQEEARMFAIELDKVIRPLFPVAWSALVD